MESHLFESFYKNWEVKGEESKSNNQDNDPKEAEYLAKVLINDANERKLSVACTKLFNGLFGIEYKKEVKIKGKE